VIFNAPARPASLLALLQTLSPMEEDFAEITDSPAQLVTL
jgi:hypothetical protein